jgi:proteasome lid subunit RPN8/RPN11
VAVAVTLRLAPRLLAEIRQEAERAYPGECCGAIAGPAAPVKRGVRLYPLPNLRTDDPHRYLIDADQLRRVERDATVEGWEVLGFYHSHPDHPAVPSEFDVAHAWPWYSYLILRVASGRAQDAASWVLHAEEPRMEPEAFEIESEV